MLYVNPGINEWFNGAHSGATLYMGHYAGRNNDEDQNVQLLGSGIKEAWLKVTNFNRVRTTQIGYYFGNKSNHWGILKNDDGDSDGFYAIRGDWDSKDSVAAGKINFAWQEAKIMIHLKSDALNGLFEIYGNGTKVYSYTGAVYGGNDIDRIMLSTYGSYSVFYDIIAADFDISDYEFGLADISSAENNFSTQTDGTIKATATGQAITLSLDGSGIASDMKQKVDNPEIVGVLMGSYDMAYDSSVIDTLKTSLNGTDVEALTIANSAVCGTPITVNPLTKKAWTLSDLNNLKCKFTAAKA